MRLTRRRPLPGAPGSSAGTLERLAVLLEAGVAPAAAWAHLAAASGAGSEARILLAVAEALARGEPGADALSRALVAEPEGSGSGPRAARSRGAGGGAGVVQPRGPGSGVRVKPPPGVLAEWQQAAAAWEVSELSGSRLADCLRSSAESARSMTQARREADVALSGPVVTAKVVLALPAIGLVLGVLLGFDTIGVLVGSPIGWMCLALGSGLVLAARSWNAKLVARAAPSPGVPGLDLELLAVALSAGGSWTDARAVVARALDTHCPAFTVPTPASEIESLVDLSERAGVPGAALLRSAAGERRRDARATAAMAAERLGVLLMLPLGLCVLPAFLVVGIVPMFVALLSSTGWSS